MRSWIFLALATITVPQAAAKTSIRFKAVNTSPYVIRAVYVSSTSQSDWGANLLSTPLQPNHSVKLRFAGDCGTYDLRFVADKGVEFLVDEEQFCDDDDIVTVGAQAVTRQPAAAVPQ